MVETVNATSRGGALASSDQLFLTLHPLADLNRGSEAARYAARRAGGGQSEQVLSTALFQFPATMAVIAIYRLDIRARAGSTLALAR